MDVHPWSKYEIAHTRHEERVLRGIAAYNALRAHDVGKDSLDVEKSEVEPIRLLDRLLHRVPSPSARRSAETTP
jgi:hypothetical protein